MELTNAERESHLWQKLKAHYEERLAALRMQNDAMQPEPWRAHLIGQIAEVKAFLQLDKPGVTMPSTGFTE